jgi:hypothetical protein
MVDYKIIVVEKEEESQEEFKYPIYEIEYTNIQGRRAKADVSAESIDKSLSMLEKVLEKVGYWPSSIKNLQPITKKTEAKGCNTWVEFK